MVLSIFGFMVLEVVPKYLSVNSTAGIARVAAQGELFLMYELSSFDIKAQSVCNKLWAV